MALPLPLPLPSSASSCALRYGASMLVLLLNFMQPGCCVCRRWCVRCGHGLDMCLLRFVLSSIFCSLFIFFNSIRNAPSSPSPRSSPLEFVPVHSFTSPVLNRCSHTPSVPFVPDYSFLRLVCVQSTILLFPSSFNRSISPERLFFLPPAAASRLPPVPPSADLRVGVSDLFTFNCLSIYLFHSLFSYLRPRFKLL